MLHLFIFEEIHSVLECVENLNFDLFKNDWIELFVLLLLFVVPKPILMKNIFRNTLFLFTFLFSVSATAQLEKVMHQTFEVNDLESIQLDLTGEYTIEKWAGNTVMTETKVELYEASPAILNHFIEKAKRYEITADTLNTGLVLSSLDKERKPIRTKFAECPEIVNLRVFVPDNFEMTADSSQILVRKSAD